MCCTLAKARLSNTILYAGEMGGRGGGFHILGYQNTVQDLSDGAGERRNHSKDWDYKNPLGSGGYGNAMILPIPAVPNSMGRSNAISTDKCPNILKDMASALKPNSNTFSAGAALRSSVPKKVEIFDIGIYTVVLASHASLIPGVLNQVPEEKRPNMNEPIFEAYDKWYPDWTFVFPCFSNKDARTATPLLWQYMPMYPDFLFLPALDAHTGDVPDLSANVDVDHTVIVSSHRMIGGYPVRYTDIEPNAFENSVEKFLPHRVIGSDLFHGKLSNGDFVCHLNDVHNGKFAPKRLLPPGVPRKNS